MKKLATCGWMTHGVATESASSRMTTSDLQAHRWKVFTTSDKPLQERAGRASPGRELRLRAADSSIVRSGWTPPGTVPSTERLTSPAVQQWQKIAQ